MILFSVIEKMRLFPLSLKTWIVFCFLRLLRIPIWPWNAEWSRAKTNRVLPRECTGRSKHPLPTTQEKTLHMNITRWSTPKSDWLYSLQPKMEKLYTVKKTRPRADCGSYHELLIAQIRLKLKKVGKTTRPFRYDINQIPYDCTVELRNRFKDLVWLTDCLKNYDIVQEAVIKTIPKKKKCKKAKLLSEEALQITVKREAKGKGEKERYTHLNAEFQRITGRDKKAFRNRRKQ